MMSATNHSTGFQALPPARAMLHDMVSMAISLGGLVLVIFTGSGTADDGYDLQHALDDSQYGAAFTLRRLMNTAHWFLMAVMYAPLPGCWRNPSHVANNSARLWRLLFAVWGCYVCVRIATPEHQRLRHRRQMEEAQMYDA